MKPPSLESIATMKQRGFDPERIKAEEARLEHYQDGLELCPIIEAAFADVKLGGGVGLFEAQGLDDYADAATCARYRADDEKDDWRRISSESLRRCNSSLSFFDAEGMRFHLPAYLLCELRGEYGFGMAFCLSQSYVTSPDKFSLLDSQQRIAVRQFLLHIVHDPAYDYDRPHIERALDEYWIWPSEPQPRSAEPHKTAGESDSLAIHCG